MTPEPPPLMQEWTAEHPLTGAPTPVVTKAWFAQVAKEHQRMRETLEEIAGCGACRLCSAGAKYCLEEMKENRQ